MEQKPPDKFNRRYSGEHSLLGIAVFVEVMELLPVGVPDENPEQWPRLSINKIAYR